MEVQQDFEELLKLFKKHQVEYLIVGAYALAYHGAPRYTGDLDIFVKSNDSNAQRILDALKEFGFGSVGLKTDDFKKADNVIQLGNPPVRIDIITSITGVSWKDAFEGKVEGSYGDVPVFFIGKNQFIRNKKAVNRKKDIADIEAISS